MSSRTAISQDHGILVAGYILLSISLDPFLFPSVLFLLLLLFKYGLVNECPIIPVGSPLLMGYYSMGVWRYFFIES